MLCYVIVILEMYYTSTNVIHVLKKYTIILIINDQSLSSNIRIYRLPDLFINRNLGNTGELNSHVII